MSGNEFANLSKDDLSKKLQSKLPIICDLIYNVKDNLVIEDQKFISLKKEKSIQRLTITKEGNSLQTGDVSQWLHSIGLQKYAQQMEDQEYDDLDTIKRLNPDQFTNMIKSLGCSRRSVIAMKGSLGQTSKEKQIVPSKDILHTGYLTKGTGHKKKQTIFHSHK